MEEKNKTRVWFDGCFDLFHFGHANALRQAKQFGDVLVVGVHSDEAITENKGPPIFNAEERAKMVHAIKWVDEVVVNVQYVTKVETLDKYNCDFCAHGDDISTTKDKVDSFKEVKDAKRFKEFERTSGISSTDLVGRMLLITKSHHDTAENKHYKKLNNEPLNKNASLWTKKTDYIPNMARICHFQEGIRDPLPEEKVVYVPGTFDFFHIGHVSLLEKCLELGNYIIIGLYSDNIGNSIHSSNYPIMNIHERLLTILSCKHVSNVIIGANPVVSKSLIDEFRIDYVVQGMNRDHECDLQNQTFFQVPKKLGIFRQIESGSSVTNLCILQRIIDNRMEYEIRNKEKNQRELAIQNELK